MIKYLKLLRREIEKYPFVSFVLVGLNLLIFILCLIFPWIYEKGCCGIYQVFECKEYGRILWSVFCIVVQNIYLIIWSLCYS